MAPIISIHFFPHTFTTNEVLIMFAVSYICRPLGGIIFGHYGDTQGRVKVLRLSTLIIALSTFLIGLLPSYANIGITATILFIGLRLAQGFSIGGEYSGIMVYIAETASQKKRGFTTSFAAVSTNIGFLSAVLTFILLKAILTDQALEEYGWRLPFILTGLPSFLFLFYRFKLTETHHYLQLKSNNHIEKKPFLAVLQYAPGQLLKIFLLTCMSSSFYYILFGYMPFYLSEYIGLSLNNNLILQSCLLLISLFLIPVGGWCGDYFTRKKMLIFTTTSVLFLALPCFYLLQIHSIFSMLLAFVIAVTLSSLDQGNIFTAIVENCPKNVRYSALAFSYNLGNAVFGGASPIIVALLIEKGGINMPAFYLMIMSIISLIAVITLLNNNQILDEIGEVKKYP